MSTKARRNDKSEVDMKTQVKKYKEDSMQPGEPISPIQIIFFLALIIAMATLSSCNFKKDQQMSGMQKDKMTDSMKGSSSEYLNDLNIPFDKHEIISSLPAIHPGKKTISQNTTAEGVIAYDTRQERNIASRFSGRIEKLYVKYMYQPVKQDELLMEIYSPEMITDQENLIFLISDSSSDQNLIAASKRKLLLLDMREKDIEQVIKSRESMNRLPVYSPYEGHIHEATIMNGASEMNASSMSELSIKEGMYVQKGQTIFNLLNPHMVWAVLKIYADDAAKIKLHQKVQLAIEGTQKTINGQIDFIEPFFEPNSKTLTARVYLDNKHHALKVGMFVKATIKSDSLSGVWIPRIAMLDLGKQKIVWRKKENVYEAHEIKTGIVSGDLVQVMEGLSDSDEIASNAQYIADSESLIKSE
ncbi:MAG: efflux RND transporter periplasmic adaptor subunit [Chitinophagales bacterium]